jgi:4-hydroxy-tetrahydrodipicolinate reductase
MKKLSIAIIGYGKMGKEIEKFAIEKGHEIACTVDSEAEWKEKRGSLKKADVAIEFSTPQVAVDNIKKCFDLNLAVVTGTTGWQSKLDDISSLCKEKGQTLFYASNFSLGVNVFFELNKKLASMLAEYNEYELGIEETHHKQKLDAPSGTAITLAKDIMEINKKFNDWQLAEKTTTSSKIPIKANREDNIFGTHEVYYNSKIDSIKITHIAKSRIGFVKGAVAAAEWVAGKKGFFTMKDLLNF